MNFDKSTIGLHLLLISFIFVKFLENQSIINIYIYKSRDLIMQKSLRLCHMAHSMKRIEILLEIRTNLKIETFYFIWFNVSRLLFVTVFIQCFKIIICFIWFKFLRIFLSLTYKKLFAFPFTLFSSTPLYTHVHSLSYHPISNMLRQKTMSFTFNFSMTLTRLQRCSII